MTALRFNVNVEARVSQRTASTTPQQVSSRSTNVSHVGMKQEVKSIYCPKRSVSLSEWTHRKPNENEALEVLE